MQKRQLFFIAFRQKRAINLQQSICEAAIPRHYEPVRAIKGDCIPQGPSNLLRMETYQDPTSIPLPASAEADSDIDAKAADESSPAPTRTESGESSETPSTQYDDVQMGEPTI
jgi:hypothetical protein